MAQISHEVTLFLSINFSETCVQVQYDFVHESLSELVVCGETEVTAANIRIAISQLQRQVTGDVSGISGFQKQFQVGFLDLKATLMITSTVGHIE
jgi:hypothetical protein